MWVAKKAPKEVSTAKRRSSRCVLTKRHATKTQNTDEVPCLNLAKSEAQAKFKKTRDVRGHEIAGLWERNGRYYLQISVPGKIPGKKGCRRVPLRDVIGPL